MAKTKIILAYSSLSIDTLQERIEAKIVVRGGWEAIITKKTLYTGSINNREFILSDARVSPRTPRAILRGWLLPQPAGTNIKIEVESSENMEDVAFGLAAGICIPLGFVFFILGFIYGMQGIFIGLLFMGFPILFYKRKTPAWNDPKADELLLVLLNDMEGKIIEQKIIS